MSRKPSGKRALRQSDPLRHMLPHRSVVAPGHDEVEGSTTGMSKKHWMEDSGLFKIIGEKSPGLSCLSGLILPH